MKDKIVQFRIFPNVDAKKFSIRKFEKGSVRMWYVRVWVFCVVFRIFT